MGRDERWLPWLLPFVALLPDPGAALPRLTYFFRDFSVTFYPLRLLLARELRAGRWPFWNPYVAEGTFLVPFYYPPDLLLALRPTPEIASWLLTLHLPLAALGLYALARELGLRPLGAFAAGATVALGGFGVSCLNLYVFLQALALAPWVALTLRRAALSGGRAVVAAALAVALSLSTLAVEFVGQALLLGIALGLEACPRPTAVMRLLLSLSLGLGLAAVPVAVMLGLLPETSRGIGFGPEIALANSLHPAALLQVLVPGIFGSLQSPAEAFWGGRFFSKGFPYFVSLYLGPFVLASCAAGLSGFPRRRGLLLGALAVAGLWFALGPYGGLAAPILGLPGFQSVRFPSKALLLPFLACALFAGAGLERLRAGQRWGRFLAASLACAVGPALLGLLALGRADLVAEAFALRALDPVPLARTVSAELGQAAALAMAGAALALTVRRGRVAPSFAAGVLATLLVVDLARAAAGVNPQLSPRFFAPTPELAGEGIDDPARGRLFSFETERSPAVASFLARGGPGRVAAAFLLHRRLLAPYTNVIDRVETALGKDLGGVILHGPELAPEEYAPAAIGQILPRLRTAGVSRLLTLDTLEDPGVELLRTAPTGLPGMTLRLYALREPLPVASLACRVHAPPPSNPSAAAAVPLQIDPVRDVVLEQPVPTTCGHGSARLAARVPGRDEYEVEADGHGLLVTRDSFARGWRANVDGRPVPVLLANGKHRAVPVPEGRHRVVLRYHPPGLGAGVVVFGLAGVVCVGLGRRWAARRSG